MNRNYDKLLLIIAVLLLAIGISFVFIGGSGTGKQIPNLSPVGSDYSPLPLPKFDTTEATWAEASEQSTGWIYDVFTPPKIYINLDTGEWVSEGWTPAPDVPFGVYLAELSRALYRLQLVGYIEEDFKDASKSLLLVVDQETDDNLRVRVGEVNAAAQFEVKDFQIKRVFGDDGSITKLATATLLDSRTNKEVVLTHGQILYTNGVSIVVRSDEDPTIEWKPKVIGDSISTDLGDFTLAKIDLNNATIDILKDHLDDSYDQEMKTLSVAVENDSEESSSDNGVDNATNANPFDSMF